MLIEHRMNGIMSITETNLDDNVTPLRVLQGGKQPPKKGDNWVGKLNQWAWFIARNSSLSKVDLFLFQAREKYANTRVLILHLPKEEAVIRYVSIVDFSNDYELMDILDNGEDDRSNEAERNGGERSEPNRSDIDGRLETNESSEPINTVVRETE